MNKTPEVKNNNPKKDEPLQDNNLQNHRVSVLETHLKENKNKISNVNSKPDNDENHFKIIEINNNNENLLSDFLNSISSSFSSIEYSSGNLQKEFERIINTIALLSNTVDTTRALERTLKYINSKQNILVKKDKSVDLENTKNNFIIELTNYKISKPQRAAEYFIANNIFEIDEELKWIITHSKGELLVELIVSALSIKQAFELLNSANNQSRNLIISLKENRNKIVELYKLKEEEKPIEIKQVEPIISTVSPQENKLPSQKNKIYYLKLFIKVAIVLLNVFVVLKIIFHS